MNKSENMLEYLDNIKKFIENTSPEILRKLIESDEVVQSSKMYAYLERTILNEYSKDNLI